MNAAGRFLAELVEVLPLIHSNWIDKYHVTDIDNNNYYYYYKQCKHKI